MATPVVNIYPRSGCTYDSKEAKIEKDSSPDERLARMQAIYERKGCRKSVEGILMTHEHNHPCILVLMGEDGRLKLPGGRLNRGENAIEGLKRKLSSKLAPNAPALQPDWQIGECVGRWWRPDFEEIMYPYCPFHITRPKEFKKLFLVHLSEREHFEVPANFEPAYLRLFGLYDNAERCGPVLASIPLLLSKFQFNCINP